jgi:hypothetical protein
MHQDVYPRAEDFDIRMAPSARMFIEIVLERREAHLRLVSRAVE